MAFLEAKASTLVVAEHEGGTLKGSSLSAIAAAGALKEGSTVSVLLGGSGPTLQQAARNAAAHPVINKVSNHFQWESVWFAIRRWFEYRYISKRNASNARPCAQKISLYTENAQLVLLAVILRFRNFRIVGMVKDITGNLVSASYGSGPHSNKLLLIPSNLYQTSKWTTTSHVLHHSLW